VAITGGFFFGLLEIEIIGLLLDMLCPGGHYTLSGFRWAMSTQLVLFAIGLAGLEVNQRRLYQIMADNGVTVPTWREALAR
ncbi:MFS transporter, partial [Xanthomonas citri pv. citri]|nr:MFS transporter [Xanthomonas citri pv. citri]